MQSKRKLQWLAMFFLYTFPLIRLAHAKIQNLKTICCIVKLIPWNIVNLSHLYKLKNISPFTLKILEGGGDKDPTSPLLTSPPPSFLPPETQANICYHKVLDSTRTRSKLDFNCALCSLTEKKLRKPQEIWDMLEFKRTKELTMGQKVLWIRLL